MCIRDSRTSRLGGKSSGLRATILERESTLLNIDSPGVIEDDAVPAAAVSGLVDEGSGAADAGLSQSSCVVEGKSGGIGAVGRNEAGRGLDVEEGTGLIVDGCGILESDVSGASPGDRPGVVESSAGDGFRVIVTPGEAERLLLYTSRCV